MASLRDTLFGIALGILAAYGLGSIKTTPSVKGVVTAQFP